MTIFHVALIALITVIIVLHLLKFFFFKLYSIVSSEIKVLRSMLWLDDTKSTSVLLINLYSQGGSTNRQI